jgi:hypothetical protein
LARLAEGGCLVELPWRGGFAQHCKPPSRPKQGHYLYIAMWQGLRNEDLDIDTATELTIICTGTGGVTTFQNQPLQDTE